MQPHDFGKGALVAAQGKPLQKLKIVGHGLTL